MYFFKNKKWLWIIYNRTEKKVIDFEIGERSCKTPQKLFCRNKHKNLQPIIIMFANKYMPKDKHVTGKYYTQGIENLNGRIKHIVIINQGYGLQNKS